MAAQPVYPIGLGMFTPMVAMPVAGDSQGVSDMAAPQLVMLANVALTSEGTSCECLTEEKQMVELKTVESGSYSDSEDEALARFSGFDSPAEESAVVYPEVQPAPECQAVVERVAEEPRSDHEVVAEPLEQEQSPSGMGKRKRIQRPVEPPKKKKPFHCKPCQYQAECEEDFVHHIRRHSAKKLIVVNGAEGEGVSKDSPSNADGGEGLVYAKGVIRCERCGYNTNRYDHYLAHLKHHTKEGESQRVYKCTICTYTTISQYHWKKHLRNHFPSKLYTCAQCCYFSDRKNNYVQHIRTHTGERPFRCPYCKYSSSQKTHLTRHMRTHSGERPFKCETCSYLAANQHEVTRHARQVHNGPKPLSCPHCQYKTADRSNYKKHVELHINPRQFLCPVCSYAASKKCNLQYHIKSRHPDCSEITMDVSKVKLRVKKPDSSSTYYNVDGDGQYVLTGIKERKGQLEKKFVRQGNAVTDDQQTPINLSVRKPARPAPAPIVEKERKDKTPKRGEQVPEKAGAGKAEKGFTEEKGMEKQNTQKVEKCERVVRSGGRTAKMEKADCDGKQAEGGLEKMEKKKEKEAKRTAKAPRAVDVAEVKTPSKRGRKSVKPASTEGKVKMEKVEKKKAKAERERVDKERTEKARVEKERAEKRVEKERVEREGAEKERTDREKQEKEQAERQRVEKERVEKEQVEREENERAEREEKERAERERVENERAERERVEKERAEKERVEKEQAERAERERVEKERAEKERVEKEQAETAERERVEKERAEKERVEKEQAETAERESVEKEKTEREKAEAKNRKTVKSVKNAFRRSVKVVKKNQDQGRDSEYWEVPRKTERMEVPSSYGKRKAEDTELSSHKQEASEQPFVSRKSKRRKDEDTPLQRANTLRSRRKVLPTCQASKGKNDGLDLPTVIQLPRKTKKAQSKKKQSPSLVEPYGADKTIVAQEFVVENPAIKTQAPAMEAEHQAFIETASTAQEIPVNKEQCKGVQALLGLLRNPGESVTEERRTEMEHGEVSSAPKDIPEARGSVSEPQKGDSGGPSSPLELPRTSHKPAETEEDEGIHSHDGSDISDNVSEGSDDSGLSGSGKLAGPETPTEEAPPSVTPTALPSHTCIFCDRTFPMEVEYRRHLNRHLVNVYYLENAAAEKQ